jgi:DNA-binding response OmpR family regulator
VKHTTRAIPSVSVPESGNNTMAKVIVVDDDYSTTALIRMLLEMEGYAVSTHIDAAGAMNEATADVSAFVIDCYLGKDAIGIDLLRAIRDHSDAAVRGAPVIMVSGDQRLADTVLSEGADRFLLKPYSPSDLTEQINELIAARA